MDGFNHVLRNVGRLNGWGTRVSFFLILVAFTIPSDLFTEARDSPSAANHVRALQYLLTGHAHEGPKHGERCM